ncbi:hypothetical protein FGG08_007159 [Glutinoglossum americanum]|uniref:Uncharacterized protein n=1 Tax=Glutinoglossum americanum TaxID=1670608 RepID=A0A9P8KZN3_9PEZI|nr:hypothetical protein FGG08_007159 [Glutinoglossum americanum]
MSTENKTTLNSATTPTNETAQLDPYYDFEVDSIPSMTTGTTQTSISLVGFPGGAVEELVSLLVEDIQLRPLYQVAIDRAGPDRFERNFARLLRLYSLDLHAAADSALKKGAVQLVRARRGHIAGSIKRLFAPDSSDKNVAMARLKAQEACTSLQLEKYLQQFEAPDETPDHIKSRSEESDTEDTDIEDPDEQFALPNLRQVKVFLLSGKAFHNLRENFRRFVYLPTPPDQNNCSLDSEIQTSDSNTIGGTGFAKTAAAESFFSEPVMLPVTPNKRAEPEKFRTSSASPDHEIFSNASGSTYATSFSDLNASVENLGSGDEEVMDDDILPHDIDPDDRLVNPVYYFKKLRDIEAVVYKQSALRLYGVATLDQEKYRERLGTHDYQPLVSSPSGSVPQPSVKAWEEVKPNQVHQERRTLLLHLSKCRNIIFTTLSSLTRLRNEGFCEDCFSLLSIAKGRPGVARLNSLGFRLVERLAQAFENALCQAGDYSSYLNSEEWYKAESILELNQTCQSFMDSLGLLDDGSAHQNVSPELLWHRVVLTLDLAVLSYSGAHVSRLDERHLGLKKDCFQVPSSFLAPELPEQASAKRQETVVNMRRRSLRCMDGFLRSKQVWVFHLEPQEHPLNISGSDDDCLYLSTEVTTLASIWGPLWETSSKSKPEDILEYSLGNGSILPWPAGQNEEQYILPDETFCHWISSRERANVDAALEGVAKRHFNGAKELLIGIGTVNSFKEQYKNSNCLHQAGTTKPTKILDAQTVQVQVGAMGLAGSAGFLYKIDNGQTWKEALVDRWEKEPNRRNPRALEHWFGVEVSACTENARRRRLLRVLGNKTMLDYLDAIGFSWSDNECKSRYRQSLYSGKSSAFRELYIAHPEWRTDLAGAVVTSLKALYKTGVSDSGMLSAFWVTEPGDEWIVTLRKSEHTWISLLKDTTESGTMAVLVDKCLKFDQWLSRRCLSKIENGDVCRTPQGYSVFETAIAVNKLVKPIELTRLRDSNKRKKRSWDVSSLQKGCSFVIDNTEGKQGKLILMRDALPDKPLFMEWKPSFGSTREIHRRLNEDILGKEAGKYHEEYIRDGQWESDKIVVHVMSKTQGIALAGPFSI